MGIRDWFKGKKPEVKQPEAGTASALTGQLLRALQQRGFVMVDRDEEQRLGSGMGMSGFTMKPPKDFTGDPAAILAEIMGAARAKGAVKATVTGRPGIEPPTNDLDRATDSLGWAQWRHEMECMTADALEGWAPCRFVNRLGVHDNIAWVFGVAKGHFGIFTQPYPVCHHPHDMESEATATFEPSAILAAVTHLPTGFGMGIFHDRATACHACDLIAGMPEWRQMPQTEDNDVARGRWREVMGRVNQTWEFNGINWSMDWHAHNGPGGGELGIWTKSEAHLNEGKPEKLS